MPVANIKLIGKLSYDQKEELSKGITEVIEKVTGKDPSYTYVVIDEVEKENWAKGGKLFG